MPGQQREKSSIGVWLYWANTNTGRRQGGSPFYFTQIWLLLFLTRTPFLEFSVQTEQKRKPSDPKALAVAGSERAAGINSVIPWTENNQACKLAKLKPLVLHVLIGSDAVKLSAPRWRDNRSLKLKLCRCLNVKPLGCNLFYRFLAISPSSGVDLGTALSAGRLVGWSTSLVQTEISPMRFGWIALTFRSDAHGPQRMQPNDVGDPLTFPVAPPWCSVGKNIYISI